MKQRAHSTRPAGQAPSLDPAELTHLIDIRDDLAETRCLIAAAWLACGSPTLSREIAAALSALNNIARERLEDTLAALDALIASVGDKGGSPRRE